MFIQAKKAAVLGFILAGIVIVASGASAGADGERRYRASWESLDSHPVPEWYQDAKFGIFIHWGVYSVPAYHEWYVTFMSPEARFAENLGGPPYYARRGNLKESVFKRNTSSRGMKPHAYLHHRQDWGADFAYDEFIPMFTAEKFRPERWADLFEDAGARYVVLTAKHGDEFALWPSDETPRNAGDTGPRRDLCGDLAGAVRKKGLRMGLYHNTTYSFWDPRYPRKGWVEYMNRSIRELIDRYEPSILWGDVRTGPARDRDGEPLGADHWNSKHLLAYFYNNSQNPDEVVANDRWGVDSRGNHHGDYATPERRVIESARDEKWETCDSLDPNSWGYRRFTEPDEYKTANEVVDLLVDVVSKNGNLLLNIGPKPDGTIPDIMRDRLRAVGQWLDVNGEAIYGTRPWKTYKEGSVRFTAKEHAVYAICLEWPDDTLTLRHVGSGSQGGGRPIARVSLLGGEGTLDWSRNAKGLTIQVPAERPCRHAYAFKLEFEAQ